MLGNILFQILMFIIIWDIYLRIGGQNTNLKNRILYLLFDVALCIWGQLIGRYIGIVPPLVAIVTLTSSLTVIPFCSKGMIWFTIQLLNTG